MSCPHCQCGDSCGRESIRVPDHNRSSEVLEAVLDLYSKHRWVRDMDPLYLAQELTYFGYFDTRNPPTLDDTGHAQDLIREVER